MHGMHLKVISDIHGAADALRREAAGADALLVCGDLVNLIDYRTLQGIAADVFGPEVTREFVAHRTAGRFEEAGRVLRSASQGREDQIREQVRTAVRAQYEAVFAAFPEPTYLTHGNVDNPEQFQDLLRPGIRHLDGETVELGGLRVGFVGGAPLPAGRAPRRGGPWHPHVLRVEEYTAVVAALGPVDLLCSHVPPAVPDLAYDVVAPRPEAASTALLDVVHRDWPRAALFGHVHQPLAARVRVGRTECVNVGYFRRTGRPYVLHC